jgi:hypothetical protein
MYDLVIFPTIWLEGVILGARSRQKSAPDKEIQETKVFAEERIDNLDEPIEAREPHE